jgi:outer membrane protein OmpA-like peptidoglycan-associated protein
MRQTLLTGACLAGAACLAVPAAAYQQPKYEVAKPQYSVEDIQKDFAPEPESSTRQFMLPGQKPATPIRPAPSRPLAARPSTASAISAARPPVQRRNLLITFGNGSAALTEQAMANASVFAQAINSGSLAGSRFAIEGHTNAIGARDYNLSLSRARAQALADFLVSLGVDPSRLDVEGYGFDRPYDAGNPRSEINRRVEARRL